MKYEIVPRGSLVTDRLIEAVRQNAGFDALVFGTDLEDVSIPDVVRRIRSEEGLRTLPIIVLTTPSAGSSLANLEREAVTQLAKPIRFSELYNCLEGSLSRRSLRAAVAENRSLRNVGPRARVLVVDDNEINQFVAVEELDQHGYHAEVASNGLEALGRIKEGGFAAVLMDCQMPVMDGYAATAEVRRWEAETGAHRVPIIALTAHALAGERERVLHAGMDNYISKPFRSSALEKILRMHVRDGDESYTNSTAREVEEVSREVKRSETLLRLFLEKIPEQLADLAKAIDRADANAVRARAHKVKGSCIAVGANPTSKIAEAMQHKAEQGDISEAKAMFQDLSAHLQKVERLMRDELVSRAAPGPAGSQPGEL